MTNEEAKIHLISGPRRKQPGFAEPHPSEKFPAPARQGQFLCRRYHFQSHSRAGEEDESQPCLIHISCLFSGKASVFLCPLLHSRPHHLWAAESPEPTR